MPTAITKTIGTTGRQYSTIAGFEAAIPADIVSSDETWTGECYNDSEFSERPDFAGATTDATHWIKLTAAAGQSFADHADKLTNPLRYDQSKGVGLALTGSYGNGWNNTGQNDLTIERIQSKQAGNGYGPAMSATRSLIRDWIHEQQSASTGISTPKGINIVCITTVSGADGIRMTTGYEYYGCLAVRCSDVATTGTGFSGTYSPTGITIRNCASFGFATAFYAGAAYSGSAGNNCTDAASAPGSSNQVSKTFANQFVSTTTSAKDFRLKTGSDCVGNGFTDATNEPTDIVGTTRPQGSAYDIGPWELAAGITATVNQATETDLAQPIAWAPKKRLLGQASEADTAQGVARLKAKAIGQPSETDAAQAATALKATALGQPGETDAAQVVSVLKTRAVGQTSETDSAGQVTRGGTFYQIGQASETDTSQAVVKLKARSLGQPSETDAAQALTRIKLRAIGQCAETSLAQAIARQKARTLGQASETDTAQPIIVDGIVFIPSAARTFHIHEEDRVLRVPAEYRVLVVRAENRVLRISE